MPEIEIRKTCQYDDFKHFCLEELKEFQVEVVPGLLESDFSCFVAEAEVDGYNTVTLICNGTPKKHDPTEIPEYNAHKFGAQADLNVIGSLLSKNGERNRDKGLFGGVGGGFLFSIPMNFIIHKYGDLITPLYQALFSVGPEIGVNAIYGASDRDTSSIQFMLGARHSMIGSKNVGYKLSFGYIMDKLMFGDEKDHGLYVGMDLLLSKIAGRVVNRAAFTWGLGTLLSYFPKDKDLNTMARTFVGFLY